MTIDSSRWARIEQVLDDALELPVADRAAHVMRVCAEGDGVREQVLALLSADQAAGSFLEPPSAEHMQALLGEHDAEEDDTSIIGRVVGAYRLTGRIGEGGMGVVYDAERADGHFESHVAVKLLAMSSARPDARRRFVRERQILARLEHPHIARLLDGGLTDDGTPYFVMERVTPGVAITTHCDTHHLSVDERLRMMLQACDAVQYAHGLLIVHRDLKPSNIVVDASGAVKLLDFGIAKLLADDPDPFGTLPSARPMTPAYAAPEQMSGGPVTTATDVYALGMVLYALLAGRLPFDFTSGSLTDWVRAVLETMPQRPSASVDDARLASRLRGDLDRIVLKALEKEPARRYPSVEALAADIRRHLAGLPVSAHESSRWYRTTKFVRRNRVLVGAMAATIAALAIGLGTTMWQAQKARAEARRAEAVQAFLVSVFEQADPDRAQGRDLTAKEILKNGSARIDTEFAAQPEVRSALWKLVRDLFDKLGDYQSSVAASRRSVEAALAAFGPRSLPYGNALRQLAGELMDADQNAEAAEPLAQALPIIRETAGERSDDMVEAVNLQGWLAISQGNREAGIAWVRRATELARELHGPDSQNAARLENDLVVAIGDGEESMRLSHHVTSVYRTAFGAESYSYSIALYNEGFQLFNAGRWNEAVKVFEEALPIQEKLLGERHAKTALTYRQLARASALRGDFARARPLMTKAIDALASQFGARSTAVALARGQLANIERMRGSFTDAIAEGRRGVDAARDSTDSPSNKALVLVSLAPAYLGNGDVTAALESAREAVRLSEGPDHRWLGASLGQLGAALLRNGQASAAVSELRRALTTLRDSRQTTSTAYPDAMRWLADAGAGTMSDGERAQLYKDSLASFATIAPAEQADALDAQLAYATFLHGLDRTAEARALVTGVLAALDRSTGLDPRRRSAATTLMAALDSGRAAEARTRTQR